MSFKILSKNFLFLLAFFSLLFITSCGDEPKPNVKSDVTNLTSRHSSNVAQQWINLYMDVEKDLPGFRPAATSRALGYIWLAAYEAGLPGMPDFVSNDTKPNFNGLNIPDLPKDANEYDWVIAVNTALYETTNHFMHNTNTSQKGLIKDLETTLNDYNKNNIDQTKFSNSQQWGKLVAEAVIKYSQTDIEAEKQILDPFAKNYTPPTGPGKWRGGTGSALFPYWGKTRTFATFNNQLLSPEPPVYSTSPASQYYKDFYEVYENVKNLTTERRWRAEFWSDDIVSLTFSPPARIFQIANQMMQNENANLEFALHMLLKLGIAENDAAVAAWGSKYYYNVERPTHFITDNIDKDWRTPLGFALGLDNMTPPFPGYPSGHSTFGGLGISVLSEFFGHEYTFTDRCHQNRTEFYGTPRTYTNQTQIGEENAFSRIPLGVHPRFDCTEGLRLGKLIGQNAVDYNVRKR